MTALSESLSSSARVANIDAGTLLPGALYRVDDELLEVIGQTRDFTVMPWPPVALSYEVKRGQQGTTAAEHEAGAELVQLVPVYGESPFGGGGSSGGLLVLGPFATTIADAQNMLGGTWANPMPGVAEQLLPGDFLLHWYWVTTERWTSPDEGEGPWGARLDIGDQVNTDIYSAPISDLYQTAEHDGDQNAELQLLHVGGFQAQSGGAPESLPRVARVTQTPALVWVTWLDSTLNFVTGMGNAGAGELYLELWRP